MSGVTPRVHQYQDNAGRQRYTLIRGTHKVHRADGYSWDRLTTSDFSPEEWGVIERTVLASFGLMTERQADENIGRVYEALAKREEVADPPPLLAHGEEWVSGGGGDDVSPR